MSVWFATNAWERDHKVTLHEKRVWMNKYATGSEFSGRLLVLNNFEDNNLLEKAKRKASALVEKGFFSDWVHAPEYIKGRLDQFNINEKTFWSENPYFSSGQLAALLYLKGKADFVLYMSGDICFCEIPGRDWLSVALRKYKKASISGFNIYYLRRKEYYLDNHSSEKNDFYIYERTAPHSSEIDTPLQRLGITLSDLAFLIPVSPPVPYDFNLQNTLKRYAPMWPHYATPCFEMLYTKYLEANSLSYGALKPSDGMPVIKHKNIKGPIKRVLRQRMLGGWYANGLYGTKIEQ